MSYMNLVYGPARHESFVAQWLEHRPVYGRSEVQFLSRTQTFSLSHARDMLITSFFKS